VRRTCSNSQVVYLGRFEITSIETLRNITRCNGRRVAAPAARGPDYYLGTQKSHHHPKRSVCSTPSQHFPHDERNYSENGQARESERNRASTSQMYNERLAQINCCCRIKSAISIGCQIERLQRHDARTRVFRPSGQAITTPQAGLAGQPPNGPYEDHHGRIEAALLLSGSL